MSAIWCLQGQGQSSRIRAQRSRDHELRIEKRKKELFELTGQACANPALKDYGRNYSREPEVNMLKDPAPHWSSNWAHTARASFLKFSQVVEHKLLAICGVPFMYLPNGFPWFPLCPNKMNEYNECNMCVQLAPESEPVRTWFSSAR